MTTDDATTLSYPGEFELLRTKAESGFWDQGTLVVTNYRVSWTPSRFAKTSSFSFDLADITSVRQIRSPIYAFMVPSLRFTLQNGAVYDVHKPKDDINRVQHVVDDYRKRDRYQPGSLFGDRS